MSHDPQQPPGAYPPGYPPPPYAQPPYYTQQPYYAQPTMPLMYGTPVLNPRPTSVTVLSIIGIVLASFWILGGFAGAFQFFFSIWMLRAAGMGAMEVVLKLQALLSIAGGVIGIALLIMAASCLRMAPWARRGIVTVAVVDLVFILAKLIVTLVWVIPMQQNAMSSFVPTTPGGVSPFGVMSGFQMAMAVAMALVMAAYPILVLVFMTKARVRQAYEM